MGSLEQRLREADSPHEIVALVGEFAEALKQSELGRHVPKCLGQVPIRGAEDVRFVYRSLGHAKSRARRTGGEISLPLHWVFACLRAAAIRLQELDTAGV